MIVELRTYNIKPARFQSGSTTMRKPACLFNFTILEILLDSSGARLERSIRSSISKLALLIARRPRSKKGSFVDGSAAETSRELSSRNRMKF